MDPFYRGRGRPVGVVVPGRDGALRHGHYQAAPIAAGHCLPYRLGDFVRPDGDGGGPGMADAGVQRAHTGFAGLSAPAGRQLLLEHPLFQPPSLWPGPGMAGGAVGSGDLDDGGLCRGGSLGGPAPVSLLPLGDLRRLSELRRVEAEWITQTASPWARRFCWYSGQKGRHRVVVGGVGSCCRPGLF